MNTTYVPTHLLYVTRGAAGWPETVADDEEFKTWLVEKCRKQLEQHGALSLSRIYDYIKWDCKTEEDRAQAKKLGAVYDHIYACIDRALRVVASQVWVLNESERKEDILAAVKNETASRSTKSAWILTVGGVPDPTCTAPTRKALEGMIEEMRRNPKRCPSCYRPLKREEKS